MPASHSKHLYYERKTTRGCWQERDMLLAIAACETMSVRDAAIKYSVPKSTLDRRRRGKNKIAVGSKKHLGRFETTFSAEFEKELCSYILKLEEMFFGLSYTDLRKLAYELADKKHISHRFNQETKMAGKKWLYSFLDRNQDLSLRSPEPTSFGRAVGFNRGRVMQFFDLLEDLCKRHGFNGSLIFNADETGMKTVHKPSKILAKKGKKQVGALTSAERGKNVTVICAVNACGSFVPPAFIFARKREKIDLIDGAPEGSILLVGTTGSGWVTAELFMSYMKHFVKYVRPSKETPVLLIVDGHTAHTKSIEVLDYCSENGVILLSLPPHTTHKLQPLDVSIFGPIECYYNQAVQQWMKEHPGRTFGEYQLASAFCKAYGKAATVANASSGFRRTGIWPINRNIFQDYEFAPSSVTDRAIPVQAVVQESTSVPTCEEETPTNTNEITDKSPENFHYPLHVLSTPQEISSSNPSMIDSSTAASITVEDISPIPAASRKGTRKSLGATILTGTPYKTELREKLATTAKPKRTVKRKIFNEPEKSAPAPGTSAVPSTSAEIPPSGATLSRKSRKFVTSKNKEWHCIVCYLPYSTSKEDWLMCVECSDWAHESCANVDVYGRFVCELCENN